MNFQKLGQTGLNVSKLSLGAMNFAKLDEETTFAILDKAHDLEFNLIDTADGYKGSEKIIGKWFKQSKAREDFLISTKVGWPITNKVNDKGMSNLHIRKQIQQSLKYLKSDYLDIYQLHGYSPGRDLQGLVRLFSQFVDEGTINVIGAPMFSRVIDLQKWDFLAKTNGLHSVQTKLFVMSLLSRSMHKSELVSLAKEIDLGLIGFGAIGGGILTGKYTKGDFPDTGREMFKNSVDFEKVKKVDAVTLEIADEIGTTPHLVALSWVLSHEFLDTVVVGASKPEHLDEYMEAFNLKLTDDMMTQLTQVSDTSYLW